MKELIIGRYLETEGPNLGRIKNKDIAFELAYTEDAWRETRDQAAASLETSRTAFPA